jgi:hypothetical protein
MGLPISRRHSALLLSSLTWSQKLALAHSNPTRKRNPIGTFASIDLDDRKLSIRPSAPVIMKSLPSLALSANFEY